MNMSRCIFILVATNFLLACAPSADKQAAGWVDSKRLSAADAEPQNWLSHGRDYAEQRFSPLAQITDANVGELGLTWFLDFGTDRGLEATPLVVDGIMYVSGAWNIVHAIDARTGTLLWPE